MIQFICAVLSLSTFTLLIQAQEQQILPTHYDFPTLGIMAVNGSSVTGECADVSIPNLDTTTTCNDTASSVLFDAHIPTLTRLDGDTWADQLVVLGPSQYVYSPTRIDSYIPYTTVRRLEITIFNCPQWGIGVYSISVEYSTSALHSAHYNYVLSVNPTVLSCDSLVTVCIPLTVTARKIRINFNRYSYVYIAEISFYANSFPCPAYTVIPGNWTAPNATEILTSSGTMSSPTTDESPSSLGGLSEGSLQKEFRPFLSVLSVFAAVQTAVIFTVGVVMVWKARRTKKVCPEEEQLVQQQQPAGKESSEEVDDEVYEIMDDKPEKPPRPPNRKKRVQYTKNNAYS